MTYVYAAVGTVFGIFLGGYLALRVGAFNTIVLSAVAGIGLAFALGVGVLFSSRE